MGTQPSGEITNGAARQDGGSRHAQLRVHRGNAGPGAGDVLTDGAAPSCSDWDIEPGLVGRSPGITSCTARANSTSSRGSLEWLLAWELPLPPCRGPAALLCETVEALVPPGEGSAPGTFKTFRRRA